MLKSKNNEDDGQNLRQKTRIENEPKTVLNVKSATIQYKQTSYSRDFVPWRNLHRIALAGEKGASTYDTF